MKLAIMVKCASSAEKVRWFKHLLDVKFSWKCSAQYYCRQYLLSVIQL